METKECVVVPHDKKETISVMCGECKKVIGLLQTFDDWACSNISSMCMECFKDGAD